MRIKKRLQRIGPYSLAVVIPKIWLIEQGNPGEVELHLGRARILVIPIAARDKNKTEE